MAQRRTQVVKAALGSVIGSVLIAAQAYAQEAPVIQPNIADMPAAQVTRMNIETIFPTRGATGSSDLILVLVSASSFLSVAGLASGTALLPLPGQ